jgi:putative NADH-flavin reductase
MKITIFGAAGGTGTQLLNLACAAGHEVTAVVRDSARLTGTDPHLTVVTADVMDPDAIGPVVSGRDAVVTAIGSREGRTPTSVQTDSAASIVTAMRNRSTRRLVVVSNSGMFTDGDGPMSRLVAKPILRRMLKHPWADMQRMEDVVRDSGLDWTIIRPPMLTNGRRTGSYRSAVDRNVRGGIRVSRGDLADSILRCVVDAGSIHTAISIAN